MKTIYPNINPGNFSNQNLNENLAGFAVFYIHNLANGKMEWFGNIKECLGREQEEIDSIDKFLSLLDERDRKLHKTNIFSLSEEITSEYSIKNGDDQISIKEIAIRSNENNGETDEKTFLYGIVSRSNIEKGNGRYSVAGKTILTGKFDSAFLQALKSSFEIGERGKYNFILFLVSIDNLPMIMSWQGEEIANKIMEDLESKFTQVLPSDDSIIGQITSDQFGIIVKNPINSEIDLLINNISKIVSLYKNYALEDAVHLRLSIGSVNFPLGVKDEFDAINKAYLALTNVKGKEYEFYCDFEDAKRDHIDAQNEMAQLHFLQEAFHQNRLKLAYQPIISAINGEVESYECLLRIANDNGRYDSAGRFIPIAEKMGTVQAIDEFVLRLVIEQLQEYKNVKLCLNISNLTTGSEEWLKMCGDIFSKVDLGGRIQVEITETAAQKDLRKTAYFTASMQAMGCSVALDDFGVGYTSFRQLRSLSVDTVKIDGSYILGLEDNKENLIFIRSLVDFNKSYGLKTVAECVENGEVAKKLIEIGVDFMQGYYFGKPEVEKPWLKKK